MSSQVNNNSSETRKFPSYLAAASAGLPPSGAPAVAQAALASMPMPSPLPQLSEERVVHATAHFTPPRTQSLLQTLSGAAQQRQAILVAHPFLKECDPLFVDLLCDLKAYKKALRATDCDQHTLNLKYYGAEKTILATAALDLHLGWLLRSFNPKNESVDSFLERVRQYTGLSYHPSQFVENRQFSLKRFGSSLKMLITGLQRSYLEHREQNALMRFFHFGIGANGCFENRISEFGAYQAKIASPAGLLECEIEMYKLLEKRGGAPVDFEEFLDYFEENDGSLDQFGIPLEDLRNSSHPVVQQLAGEQHIQRSSEKTITRIDEAFAVWFTELDAPPTLAGFQGYLLSLPQFSAEEKASIGTHLELYLEEFEHRKQWFQG